MEQREPGHRRRIADRDAGLRRLKRATALAFAGAAVLAAGFATLAAKAFPGRSSKSKPVLVHAAAVQPRAARHVPATPPPLVSSGGDAPAPPPPPSPASPPPPPAPPVVTQAPPVAVSGGS